MQTKINADNNARGYLGELTRLTGPLAERFQINNRSLTEVLEEKFLAAGKPAVPALVYGEAVL
ncbi:MAG: hypothetical protein DM484_05305 [Candidatus Methylumidiphilus alinenensis]|uniref:Uncharacterized protein n=1 Tax=Candidatus Methylumidiphilus alinenensis TaxID=2202197 RepID=A0A2W4RGV1_9GAMM|nr:MAG: hypothetical protein DM484_05305 [Candidatus Methylumidiphilus alinenensis]